MSDGTPSLMQLNRTFIGSVLFIDIAGYSTRTVPDQLEMKELFNTMLAEAVQKIVSSERLMVDTGDGAAIAFLDDPENALFAALSLRDSIEATSIAVGEPGFVRMGIALGPLKVVRDMNGHANMIGDGVNDAQCIMSFFAGPGQLMVSRSYFDIISRFSRDYAQLFVYEGTRQDKHVREHEVYRFDPLKDHEDPTKKLRDRSRARHALPGIVPIPLSAAASSLLAAMKDQGKGAWLRPGMIATAIGTTTLVGAVWSWTGQPAAAPVMAGVTSFSSTPEIDIGYRPRVEPAKAADIRADVKLFARNPDATQKPSPKLPKPTPAKPVAVKLTIQP